jgi:hypothetical protein
MHRSKLFDHLVGEGQNPEQSWSSEQNSALEKLNLRIQAMRPPVWRPRMFHDR